MKKQILCAAVLGIITLFSYTFANAQINSLIVVDIPFDFSVGDKKMPAGEYVIELVRPFSDKTTLSLRQKDGKAQIMIMTTPTSVTRKGKVTLSFNRYGDVNYLAEIRNPFAEFGVKVRQKETEINLARQFGKSKRETVSVNSPSKQKAETAAASSN